MYPSMLSGDSVVQPSLLFIIRLNLGFIFDFITSKGHNCVLLMRSEVTVKLFDVNGINKQQQT